MIYDSPKFLPGGDRYLLIEFGNEMNLDLNFKGQGLAIAIKTEKVKLLGVLAKTLVMLPSIQCQNALV